MQNVRGLICVARSDRGVIFYGPASDPSGLFDPIEANGLRTFEQFAEAASALNALRRVRTNTTVDMKRLTLAIARDEADISSMKHKRGLIVVQFDARDPLACVLIGLRNPSCPRLFDCASSYRENGQQPFTSFGDAVCVVREVVRQSASPAGMATLKLSNP